jgi:hypothetical protein
LDLPTVEIGAARAVVDLKSTEEVTYLWKRQGGEERRGEERRGEERKQTWHHEV